MEEAAKEAWGTSKTKDPKPNSERVPAMSCLPRAWSLIKHKRQERESEESRNQLGLPLRGGRDSPDSETRRQGYSGGWLFFHMGSEVAGKSLNPQPAPVSEKPQGSPRHDRWTSVGHPLPHRVGLSIRQLGTEKGVEFLGLSPSSFFKKPLSLDLLRSVFMML